MDYKNLSFKISFFSVFLFISFFLFSSNAFAASYTCVCRDTTSSVVQDCNTCVSQCSSKAGMDYCNPVSSQIPGTPVSTDTIPPQELPNPLGITDVNALIARVINWILSLVGSVSLLMFVYGGLTWMTSAGAADKVKKGRDIIVWSVIGLAIVFTSYILVRFVITSLAGVA